MAVDGAFLAYSEEYWIGVLDGRVLDGGLFWVLDGGLFWVLDGGLFWVLDRGVLNVGF